MNALIFWSVFGLIFVGSAAAQIIGGSTTLSDGTIVKNVGDGDYKIIRTDGSSYFITKDAVIKARQKKIDEKTDLSALKTEFNALKPEDIFEICRSIFYGRGTSEDFDEDIANTQQTIDEYDELLAAMK